jgi:hypothetical protein
MLRLPNLNWRKDKSGVIVANPGLEWISDGLREFSGLANFFLFVVMDFSKHYCLSELSERVVMRGQTRKNKPENYL